MNNKLWQQANHYSQTHQIKIHVHTPLRFCTPIPSTRMCTCTHKPYTLLTQTTYHTPNTLTPVSTSTTCTSCIESCSVPIHVVMFPRSCIYSTSIWDQYLLVLIHPLLQHLPPPHTHKSTCTRTCSSSRVMIRLQFRSDLDFRRGERIKFDAYMHISV
jgi:hypothetical protein